MDDCVQTLLSPFRTIPSHCNSMLFRLQQHVAFSIWRRKVSSFDKKCQMWSSRKCSPSGQKSQLIRYPFSKDLACRMSVKNGIVSPQTENETKPTPSTTRDISGLHHARSNCSASN
uniref:Predicted protein n=1 Tax=Physcomitrium patens TaxID=3218 RepID=A9U2D6_PHYPA